jgi:hypothetical protein
MCGANALARVPGRKKRGQNYLTHGFQRSELLGGRNCLTHPLACLGRFFSSWRAIHGN